MEKFIVDEHTGLKYELVGDYYSLTGDDDSAQKSLGIWGQQHLNYLKTHKEGIYTGLWLSGKLDSYLVELNQQATERFDLLIAQVAKAQGVNERLKAKDQMGWVGATNNIHSAAMEIVNQELIFV